MILIFYSNDLIILNIAAALWPVPFIWLVVPVK